MATRLALRDLLRKYGSLRAHRHWAERGVAITTELRVDLTGRFASQTMARYLEAAYLIPPDEVSVRTIRRAHGSATRPKVQLVWYAVKARAVAETLDWQVGKPKLDAQLLAWKRWRAYRTTAGVYHQPERSWPTPTI